MNTIRRHSAAGFTLVELLLSIMVTATLLIGVITITTEVMERQLAKATAQYYSSLGDAIETVLKDPQAFEAFYYDLSADGNNFKRYALDLFVNGGTISFTDPAGNAGSLTIDGSDNINSNFPNRDPLRNGVEIVLRVAPAPSGDTDLTDNSRAIESLILSTDRSNNARLYRAARETGANSGLLSAVARIGNTSRLQGVFGGWGINTSEFSSLTMAWDTNAPNNDEGGYFGYYSYINDNTTKGDYLYRVVVPFRPELNQMNAPINLSGFNILGVDDLEVDGNVEVDTQLIARGSVHGVGNNANLVVNGSMIIDGSAQITQNIAIDNELAQSEKDAFAMPNNFINNNFTRSEELSVTDRLEAETAILDRIEARSLRVNNTVNIDGDLNAATSDGLVDSRAFAARASSSSAPNQFNINGNLTVPGQVRYNPGSAQILTVQNGGDILAENIDIVGSGQTTVTGTVLSGDMNLTTVRVNPTTGSIFCESGC